MPGIVAPDKFPIRDPRAPAMKNGRNINPPRMMEQGGFHTTSKWNKDTGDAQMAQTNIAAVEKPARGAKSSHSAKNSDDD